MTRVVFLGTPEAALPSLRSLAESHEVALVITQPDRPRGRGRRVVPSPVKQEAERLGVPVAQPASRDELVRALSRLGDVELGVVVAYGRILPVEALAVPSRGMLNVHFSLLPRWRGAAPVARALMAGDPMTGVTIIRLDEGMDTGPVLTAQAVDIGDDEAAGDLTARLATLGARLLIGSIPRYLHGDLDPVAQSEEGATQAPKIDPAERRIEVGGSREAEHNRVRALSPRPGALLGIDGEPHRVLRARVHSGAPPPGTWRAEGEALVAGLADGGLELVELVPPGRRAMSGADWLRGRRRQSGTIL